MKKVRGRPRLADREGNKKRAWQPKKWQPEYERIVLGSVTGMSNTVLAQMFGYTPVHICNILNTEEAKKVKNMIVDKIRETTLNSIPDQMERIAAKTVERVETLVTDDRIFAADPYRAIDRGFRVMEHLGLLRSAKQPDVNVEKGVIVINPESAALLTQAMAKSAEVARLYPGDDK
jgi:hypothetical protein